MSIPTLKQQANGTVLTLHDKPYIMLAGEVGNSNSSSVEYMEGVWQTAEQLGMNTLLLPITWDQVEPEEGQFDFSLLDGLVLQARGKGKHLVLLWFGSWKNAECMYAPAWVKTDLQRFRRGQIVKGKNKAPRENAYGMLYTTLSYLCEETCAADARAFGRLMRHLRTLDGEETPFLPFRWRTKPDFWELLGNVPTRPMLHLLQMFRRTLPSICVLTSKQWCRMCGNL